jgi:hypothetical protein
MSLQARVAAIVWQVGKISRCPVRYPGAGQGSIGRSLRELLISGDSQVVEAVRHLFQRVSDAALNLP